MPAEPRPPLLRRLLRPARWPLVDRLVAVALGGPLLAYTATRDQPFALAGVVVVAVAVAERRRGPLAALAVLLVVAPLSLPLWAAVWAWSSALYLVATAYRVRVSAAALVVAVMPAVVAVLWAPWLDGARLGYVVLLVLVPVGAWTLGYTVRQHRAYADALRRYDVERAQRAVTEERLRIARELHDVVAHSMGVVTVQAGFGALVVDDRPDLARAALTAVEAAGREALTELRRLLGVLRDDGAGAEHPPVPGRVEHAPAPGLAAVGRLLEQTAQAGVRVTLRVTGEPQPLPPGLDLAAYRIVQESLTNIVRHAGTTVGCLEIGYRAGELVIDVSDGGRGGPGGPGGHGLVGMRERVAAYGGQLSAGPLPEGGFRVAARLPLGAGGAQAAR